MVFATEQLELVFVLILIMVMLAMQVCYFFGDLIWFGFSFDFCFCLGLMFNFSHCYFFFKFIVRTIVGVTELATTQLEFALALEDIFPMIVICSCVLETVQVMEFATSSLVFALVTLIGEKMIVPQVSFLF